MICTGKVGPLRAFKDVVFFIGQLMMAMLGSSYTGDVQYAPVVNEGRDKPRRR
ncbi:MAG: hypothetical protein KGH64_03495 [Candidatus Micrarchaeota archaeon]|nr:hypothetical protein [Candidatus Micrarchaeota archaeon]MDE1859978.1 hypothetical protein [Candidatus Micrarchaeota archaeon]